MRKILILSFIINMLTLQAEEPATLRCFLQKGLEQNYQLRIVRNNQQIADQNFTPGNAGYLPRIDLNASLNGNENQQVVSAGVALGWTIFDGFGIQANYGRLRELKAMGELRTRMEIENYVSDLVAEYYNYIQQTIRMKNLESAVRLSRERLRIVEARYLIGNLSRLDLQQARVDFNTDSSRLIRQHEVLYATRIKINQKIAEPDVEKQFEVVDTMIQFNALLNRDEIWENTQKQNIYLLMAQKETSLRVLDLQSARSSNYPYLRMNAGYGYAETVSAFGSSNPSNSMGVQYGLTLGYNLFDGFNRSRQQKNARIQIANQELVVEELSLTLRSNFSNLWMAYLNNMNLTDLERENLVHATENYNIAIERYKLGDLSGIELREAQNSLLAAEERLVQAEYNTKLCEISLLEISGGILNYL